MDRWLSNWKLLLVTERDVNWLICSLRVVCPPSTCMLFATQCPEKAYLDAFTAKSFLKNASTTHIPPMYMNAQEECVRAWILTSKWEIQLHPYDSASLISMRTSEVKLKAIPVIAVRTADHRLYKCL